MGSDQISFFDKDLVILLLFCFIMLLKDWMHKVSFLHIMLSFLPHDACETHNAQRDICYGRWLAVRHDTVERIKVISGTEAIFGYCYIVSKTVRVISINNGTSFWSLFKLNSELSRFFCFFAATRRPST